VVDSSCDINEATGQCEYSHEARTLPDHGKEEEEKDREWEENERRYFHVSGADMCPLEPEHKTCLLVSNPRVACAHPVSCWYFSSKCI